MATTMLSDFAANQNVYARPIDDNTTIQVDVNGVNTYRTLATWQAFSGLEPQSTKAYVSVPTVNDLRFEYNETATSKTFALAGNHVDARGMVVARSLILPACSLRVLIQTH